MNGALGVVMHASRDGQKAWLKLDDSSADWISPRDLDELDLGWAVSVHKAQGSEFQRVIIPVVSSRLLDRALIYTAVTRAVRTCVLIGDLKLIKKRVEANPSAYRRDVCFGDGL